jgi:opacity protein-like surface antigen
MMKTNFLLLLTLLLALNLSAQKNKKRNQRAPSLSIGFQVADPQGEYAQHYRGHPVGLGVTFMANMGRSPFEIGGDFAWRAMGSRKQDIAISEGFDIEGDEIFSDGSMRVASNIYTYHGVARFKPFAGAIQPFGDVMAGLKTFATKTTIEEDNGGYSEVVRTDRNHRDFALSYGWAAGLKIKLSEYITLESKFQHLRGGDTTFIDPETVEIDPDGLLQYEERASKSSVMLYQIGISIEF